MCLRDYCPQSGYCDRKFLGLFSCSLVHSTRHDCFLLHYLPFFLPLIHLLFVHILPSFLSLSVASLFLCSFFPSYHISIFLCVSFSYPLPFVLSSIFSVPLFLYFFLSILLFYYLLSFFASTLNFINFCIIFPFFSVCFPHSIYSIFHYFFLPLSLTSMYPHFFPYFDVSLFASASQAVLHYCFLFVPLFLCVCLRFFSALSWTNFELIYSDPHEIWLPYKTPLARNQVALCKVARYSMTVAIAFMTDNTTQILFYYRVVPMSSHEPSYPP